MKTIAKRNTSGKAVKNTAESYNAFKIFQGKQYTGMAVGRSHKWHYDPGVWIDKKITPDKWLISFEVKKRRAGKAPEGSGVPVGTEYHWFIVAHQLVKKLDANTYSTDMNGIKLKIAHKRSDKDKWNISDATQRNHLVKMLKDYIAELEGMELEDFVAGEKSTLQTKNKPKVKLPAKKKATKKPAASRKRELAEA
jgi:hypothetical protein